MCKFFAELSSTAFPSVSLADFTLFCFREMAAR